MIRANLRQRLTPEDFDFTINLLGRGTATGRRYYADLMTDEGADALLDQPGLLGLVCQARGMTAPSGPLFFYVAARHTLRDAGIDDPRLSDYLGALLLEFGLRDRAHRIALNDDAEHQYLFDILQDLETADGRRTFLLLAHLGNFSLWLAGIFPDYILARSARNGAPGVEYYDALGARGFRRAADHGMARQLELDDIYVQTAEAYATIRLSLNRLSEQVFRKVA